MHNDVFAIYTYTYCSGFKEKGGTGYQLDFCSRPGTELFDQYYLWKVWGVDLGSPSKSDNDVEEFVGVMGIKIMPRVVFVWANITIALLVVTLVVGLISWWFMSWGRIAAAVSSVVRP